MEQLLENGLARGNSLSYSPLNADRMLEPRTFELKSRGVFCFLISRTVVKFVERAADCRTSLL